MEQKKNRVLAVIPARYQSTRFPGKPLALLAGKPMIQHVFEQVSKVEAIDRVVVATDDQRIYDRVQAFGGNVAMTRSDHETGTDRLVEVLDSEDCDWILNVQGDEPMISPEDLQHLVQNTLSLDSVKLSTLIFPITDDSVHQDPNVVKVVLNHKKEALYFSRAPIPFERTSQSPRWKHIGVYLYQKDFLLEFNQWSRSELELTEQLEQLRVLEKGYSIACTVAQEDGIGVDTPEDLLQAEALFQKN